jgi:large subunit ribosomal protein L21
MNYAIIELGGKQYRVEKGDSVVVDRIDAKEGAKLSPRALLYRSEKTAVLEGPELQKVRVEAVVAEHLKGEKVRVFKYRPKKRYRRRAGHRSLLTRLEISDIKLVERKPAAKAPATKAADTPAAALRSAAEGPSVQRRAPAAKKKDAGTGGPKKATPRKTPAKAKPSSKES